MVAFLHAAHQVRNTLDGLAVFSWLAIGLGAGALVLSWGRILAWVRTPEVRGPSLAAWGRDESGWWFELRGPGAAQWNVEDADGDSHPLEAAGDLLRCPGNIPGPRAITSSEGVRLTL